MTWRFLFRARLPPTWEVPQPVHDGDTVWLCLDRMLDRTYTTVDLRLLGVYAPELSDRGGRACQIEAAAWLDAHAVGRWPFVVETFKTSTDANYKKSLGRYLATVTAGEDSLSQHMADFVLAHGYGSGITVSVDTPDGSPIPAPEVVP